MARAGASARMVLMAALATVTAAAFPLAAQSSSTAGAAAPATAPPTGQPVATFQPDLDRIREGLAKDERLRLDLPRDLPTYRVDIESKLPPIEAWLGDIRKLGAGPRVGPSFHQEFLNMVTPSDARASFTNGELLQVLATSLAFAWGQHTLINAIKGAVQSERSQDACAEVRHTLFELNRERVEAGLLPVFVPSC
jgi:hypothetical protein